MSVAVVRSAWPVARARADLLATSVLLFFFTATAVMAVTRHLTFNTRARDMGIYVQILWNAAQGRPFLSTLLEENVNHLAEHVAPVLWPLVPLAGLAPEAAPILVIQQVFLAAAGWPVYLIARARVGGRAALVVLLGYCFMPAISRVSFSEFHPVVMAAFPVAAGLACALSGRPRSAALLLLLGLLFEEEVAPIVAGLGLLLLWQAVAGRRAEGATVESSARRPKRRELAWLGLILGGIALVWTVLVVAAIQPGFKLRARGLEDENRALAHYGQVQAEPSVVWTWLTAERGPDALAWLVLPNAGLALLAPEILAAGLPGFMVLFLQDRAGTYAGHWSGPLLPIIWLATAVGLGRLARHRVALGGGLALVAAGTILAYPFDSYFPGGREWEPDHFRFSAHEGNLRRAVEQVPAGASLVATRRVVPHLAAREDLYQFPFTFYRSPLRPNSQRQEYYILDLTDSQTRRAIEPNESDSILEKKPRHHVQRLSPDVLLLSRTKPEPAEPRDDLFGGAIRLVGLEWPEGGPGGAWGGGALTVRLFWEAVERPEFEPTRLLALRDEHGAAVAEESGRPVDDYLRVRDWEPDQTIIEELRLAPPSGLPAGAYRLTVGWLSATGQSLPIDGGNPHLELARLERR